jgi:hypothetical protein
LTHLQIIRSKLFDSYAEQKHLVAYGCAGTGKTFISLYNALREVLDEKTPYEKIYLVRSLVATREIGFLPGSYDDKSDIYQIPYKNMVKYMFQMPSDADFEMLYGNLKAQKPLSSGVLHFFVEPRLIILLLLLMSSKICHITNLILLSLVLVKIQDYVLWRCVSIRLAENNERNGIIDFMTSLA